MRDYGVIRKSFGGNSAAAQAYTNIARTQLGILKNAMSFNNLTQGMRTVQFANGMEMVVRSINGVDDVRITMPLITPAGAEVAAIVSVVNKVADYIGKMMPNSAPYRSMTIEQTNFIGYGPPTYYETWDETLTTSDAIVLASAVGSQTGNVSFGVFPLVIVDGNPYNFGLTPPPEMAYPVFSANIPFDGSPWVDLIYRDLFAAEVLASPIDCIELFTNEDPYYLSYFLPNKRIAWRKKNSDDFLATLKPGFVLSDDYKNIIWASSYLSGYTTPPHAFNRTYHVNRIELLLFGPVSNGIDLGMFADPEDADGATQIAYYGEASFLIDWSMNTPVFMGWSPRKTPTIIDLPVGVSYHNAGGVLKFIGMPDAPNIDAYNCAIGYVWDSPADLWPDIASYLQNKISTLISGNGDQVLYTIIKQALAL